MFIAWMAVNIQVLLLGFDFSFIVIAWPITLFVYFLIPTLVLCICQIIAKRILHPIVYLGIPIAYLWLLFMLWAYKPWMVYGEFPWGGIYSHFIKICIPYLVLGLSFWLLTRHRTLTSSSSGTA